MRIVVAKCSVTYSGRGDTTLTPAVRAIFLKADGAISVHSDNGTKALNYMGPGSKLTETRRGRQIVWEFSNKKETLTIRLHSVISDNEHALDHIEPGLAREGTEHELQAWIARNPEVLGDGIEFIQREYPTGAGPVDLLVRTANGLYLAVEVKRVAQGMNVVDQIGRYVRALNETGELGTVEGMIAAFEIKPRTEQLAAKHGIQCVVVPRNIAVK